MAGNIKGITIQFKGETTELDEALRKLNKSTREIDSELKKVNNALKFNPNSVELWRQKQTLLSQKIKETNDKVALLKDTLKKVDLGEIEMSAEDTRNLRRELIEAESKAKHFEAELRKIGNANLKALSEQLKDIGNKMASAGKTMTTKVTAPIVAGYTVAAKYASDYEENLNKLDVAFGSNSQAVKDWANTAREAYGLSKVQATDAASAFGALGKGIGLTEGEAANMSTTLAGLSADLGSYFNVGVAESSKALEGIFTGESEALKKFGVVMTDTNLQKFAEDQGLVWKELDQTEKTMLRYQYVLAKTKDAQGDFSRTSDGTANSTKIFQASLQDLGTAIGTNLLPIITPVIQKITEILNKFNELSPEAQKIITIVGLVVAAIGPLLIIVGTLASSIGSIIGLVGTIGPVVGGALAAAGPVIAVIAAIIAIGVLLYKNWDTIKAKAIEFKDAVVAKFTEFKAKVTSIFTGIKNAISNAWNLAKAFVFSVIKNIVLKVTSSFNSLKSTVSSIWNNIKTAITAPITAAKEKVKAIIDKIKSYFPFKVGKIISGLKLPHFKLTGKFSLTPPSVPKLSVDWYKTGGIFDAPSVIGVGEAGPEAVVPLDKFWKKLDDMQTGVTQNNTFYITGNDPKAIAEEVERILIQKTNRQRLAWQ